MPLSSFSFLHSVNLAVIVPVCMLPVNMLARVVHYHNLVEQDRVLERLVVFIPGA